MEIGFEGKVYAAVRQIPPGKVATYGQIARLIGHPGAARAVGNALHRNPDSIGTPCFKIVNAAGFLSGAFAFGGIYEQRDRLRADGVEVVNFRVDLKKYQWDGRGFSPAAPDIFLQCDRRSSSR